MTDSFNNDISYSQAQKRLEEILKEIEKGEIDIDFLSDRVKEACILIKICNSKLKKTDIEVKKILDEFQNSSENYEENK